jgi:hypothetical protein
MYKQLKNGRNLSIGERIFVIFKFSDRGQILLWQAEA